MFVLIDKLMPLVIAFLFVMMLWSPTDDPRIGSIVAVVLVSLFVVLGMLQKPGVPRLAYFGPVSLFTFAVLMIGAISVGLTTPLGE